MSPAKVYSTHFSFVWRNLRRLGLPESALEDAAQEVFLTVHRRWDTYDPSWSSVETWLFGILLRVARSQRRTFRRRLSWLTSWSQQDDLLSVPASVENPADVVAKRQAAALLERLLATLDDEKRSILVLVDIEQLSVPEAAQALGTNVNTAYWRLRAARESFQKAVNRVRAAERRSAGGDAP